MSKHILTSAMLVGLAGLSALAAPAARAQGAAPTPEIQQSAALRARYADVAVTLRSPWFEMNRSRAFATGEPAAGFTTHAEMKDFIASLGNSANLGVGSIGQSKQGRDIPYLLFSAEGARGLQEAARNRPVNRPVVWLIGQQHGNEPAGGEAMLALARDLASGGALSELTRQLTVVIVPRANPDGAEAFTRDTSERIDPNRDHLLLTLPETKGLYEAVRILPPDLVIDAHEFSVGGRWMAKFQALHATDFVYLRATHPLVPSGATALADEVFLPAIQAAAASAGLTAFIYQTSPTQQPEDKTVATGGNAAGIARNTFGLGGAVSILLETRGIGIGAQGFQRRVATHYVTTIAALRAAAQDSERLVRTVAEGRRDAAASRADLIVAHRIPITPGFVPLIEPNTGAPLPTPVPFMDARRIVPTIVRPRPVAYILEGGVSTAPVREALVRRGVITCILKVQENVAGAESFVVTAREAADRRSINPDGGVATRTVREEGRTAIAAGSVLVPVAQPLGGLVVASLDPDAAGGFIRAGIVPGEVGARLPLLRLPAGIAPPIPCGS